MRKIIAVLANLALFSTLLVVGSAPLNAAPIVKSAKITINFGNNSSVLPFDAFDKIADAADAIRADSGESARVGLVAYKRQSGETTAQKNLLTKRLNVVKKDIRDFQPGVIFKTDKIRTYSKVTAPQRNRIIVYMNWNLPAPVISTVSPNFGPVVGGTAITITGQKFINVKRVLIGGVEVSEFRVLSATRITATTAARTAGVVDVAVESAGGTGVLTGGFTYATPTITSLTPATGTVSGATSVVITGSYFTGATAVNFGNIRATSFVVNSANQITAISPALPVGSVTVTVVTPLGTITSAQSFTYVQPTISSLLPVRGPLTGGNTVVISGSNINGATGVLFNGVPAQTFTIASVNQINAVVPARAVAGPVTVEVVLPSGRLSTTYTYVAAPVIGAISSTTGSANGGASVVITGTNFTDATGVIFGGVAARSFVINSANQITAITPTRAAGAAVVQVITPGGTANGASAYTFVAAPTVSSLTPNTGTTSGGTAVTINGTNLVGVTTVLFGTAAATSFNVISATQIVAIAPAVTAGVVNVTVTNAGGSAAGAYTYSAAAPSISALSPVSGTTAGGTSVVITGTNFIGTTAVTFGGVNATSFVVNSATQITAVTPPRAPGSVTIAVVTPGGTITTNFTFSSLPTATTLSPTSGTTSGGVTVTINGTNFTGATGVTFGGTNATSFTVVSATQITAVTPVRVAGAVTVDVITPGGIARASDVFTFVAATPTVSSFTPNSGSTGGATSVVITGTNFIGTTGVSIGGVTATSFVVNSATQITAVAAAGTGSGAVTVTTAGGTGTSATVYSYLAPPVISSLNVTTGSTTGGTTVVISGTGFTGTTSVTFGGTAAAIVSTTDTAITVTTPAKPAGVVTVVVTTSVSSASSANAYTYAVS
jgi:hypothetical protein